MRHRLVIKKVVALVSLYILALHFYLKVKVHIQGTEYVLELLGSSLPGWAPINHTVGTLEGGHSLLLHTSIAAFSTLCRLDF